MPAHGQDILKAGWPPVAVDRAANSAVARKLPEKKTLLSGGGIGAAPFRLALSVHAQPPPRAMHCSNDCSRSIMNISRLRAGASRDSTGADLSCSTTLASVSSAS